VIVLLYYSTCGMTIFISDDDYLALCDCATIIWMGVRVDLDAWGWGRLSHCYEMRLRLRLRRIDRYHVDRRAYMYLRPTSLAMGKYHRTNK
jgi:hypothetical protein